MNTIEIAWLAGVLEGEGCFSLQYTKYRLPDIRVHVWMTDLDVIASLQRVTNVGTIQHQYRHGQKDQDGWIVSKNKDAASIMMMVFPLMHKRRQEKIRECIQGWKHGGFDAFKYYN